MVTMRPLPAAAAAVAFSPDGSLIVVGLETGEWLLLETASSVRSTPPPPTPRRRSSRAARCATQSSLPTARCSPSPPPTAPSTCTLTRRAAGRRAGTASPSAVATRRPSRKWTGLRRAVTLAGADAAGRVRGGDAAAAEAAAEAECWLLRAAGVASELRTGSSSLNGRSRREASPSASAPPPSAAARRRRPRERRARARGSARGGARRGVGVGHGRPLVGRPRSLRRGALRRRRRRRPRRPLSCDRSHEGEVLAAADGRGGVSLWRWPASAPGAASKRYLAHTGGVGSVRFSADDSAPLVRRRRQLHRAVAPPRRGRRGGRRRRRGGGRGARGLDSDLEKDLKPLGAYRRPRGAGCRRRRRGAFLEASSLAQAARASGTALAALAPQQPSPLAPMQGPATALIAVDDLVGARAFGAARGWLRGLEPPAAGPLLASAPPSEQPPLERRPWRGRTACAPTTRARASR